MGSVETVRRLFPGKEEDDRSDEDGRSNERENELQHNGPIQAHQLSIVCVAFGPISLRRPIRKRTNGRRDECNILFGAGNAALKPSCIDLSKENVSVFVRLSLRFRLQNTRVFVLVAAAMPRLFKRSAIATDAAMNPRQ